MAPTLYVMSAWKLGHRWLEASEESKVEANKQVEALSAKWKDDPAIRYVAFFRRPDVGFHLLFQVDDVETYQRMWEDYQQSGLYMYHDAGKVELLVGDSNTDESWTS
jgi:hypothetical protein